MLKVEYTLALQLNVSGEHKNRDTFQGATADDTGVTAVYVGPQINFTWSDKLSAEEKKAVDDISGDVAARIYGRSWDKVDRRGVALMQANNVQIIKADAKFVNEVKTKTAGLEAKWIADAEAKGLKGAAKVLAEFRSEIAKQEK